MQSHNAAATTCSIGPAGGHAKILDTGPKVLTSRSYTKHSVQSARDHQMIASRTAYSKAAQPCETDGRYSERQWIYVPLSVEQRHCCSVKRYLFNEDNDEWKPCALTHAWISICRGRQSGEVQHTDDRQQEVAGLAPSICSPIIVLLASLWLFQRKSVPITEVLPVYKEHPL